MARPKSQIEYIARYKKAHITKVSVEFNKDKPDDMALLEFLNTKESKQGFIKKLIQDAMKQKAPK